MIRLTYDKKSMTLEMAERMIEAAVNKAKELGIPMCIAVVDESGNLKAFCRMDGAALLSAGVAQDKAYTAVSHGIATDEWYPLIKDDPALLTGIPHISRLVIFGGGYPIKADNEVVGGIGASGGDSAQDMEVAKAGLEILK